MVCYIKLGEGKQEKSDSDCDPGGVAFEKGGFLVQFIHSDSNSIVSLS